jgi:phospholipase C
MTRIALALASVAALLAGIALVPLLTPQAGAQVTGIHKIRHVVIIMQENRSVDSYFGTYPGAYGIPMKDGVPTVCVPDPATGGCVRPFHDRRDENSGGPHDATAATADIDGGKMDGFIAEQQKGAAPCPPADPTCNNGSGAPLPDVMGYHTGADIPNYWAYARNFVLQDHMYEPVASWSFPQHLYLVSGWSAKCAQGDPLACVNAIQGPPQRSAASPTPFAWTDITYLLARNHVTWGYYLDHGAGALSYGGSGVPLIWNTLPGFQDVHADNQVDNVQNLDNFYRQADMGTLPNVSWIIPDIADSEHPPALVTTGQSYVTNLINTIMRGPEWDSTAIFVSWDDWGGFYDHVVPTVVDSMGYGLRVPGIVIGPYAREGAIDHQTLSTDAYLKFIEDDFLGSQRLDPKTDGRPDSRPDVRESAPQLGDLTADFNFNQPPRPPFLLPLHPVTDFTEPAKPPQFGGGTPATTCATAGAASGPGSASVPCTLLAYGRVSAIDEQLVTLTTPSGATVVVTLDPGATITPRAAAARKAGFTVGDYAAFYAPTAGAARATHVLYALVPMPAIAKQLVGAGPGGTQPGTTGVTLTGTVVWSSLHAVQMRRKDGTGAIVDLASGTVFVERGQHLGSAPELVSNEVITVMGKAQSDGTYLATQVTLQS